MPSPPVLKVENLSVILQNKRILERVSFEMRPEEVLAVIGPNGSGKSVLLKTLVGIFPKAKGTIEWMPEVRIGYLPQRFHVDYYLPMTVEEFLRLKPNPRLSLAEVGRLIEVGEPWFKKNLAHLSSGQLQKALLAWSLLDEPHILLFDEPTENVDVVGQASIYKLLHHLQDAMHVAVIIVSHDLHVVYRYANHVLCLNKEMICYGTPETELTTATLSKLYGDHAFFHHHHFGGNGRRAKPSEHPHPHHV